MLQAIKAFALLGGEWILYLLIALSLWVLKVIVERYWYFKEREKDSRVLGEQLPELLAQGRTDQALELLKDNGSIEGSVLKAGLSRLPIDRDALEQVLESQKIQEKMLLERSLLVLGTLGNNAPFIGLFGTVLGIIKAFNDLAVAGTSSPSVVMRGVSEALVATAMGLFIAIPAVAAYNYFQGRIKRSLSNAERLGRLLLASTAKK